MKRAHLAWMFGEKIAADSWRALRFEVPLLRWNMETDKNAQDEIRNTCGELRVRTAIWCLAGEVLAMRHDKDQRPHVRTALGRLRRAWLAHCAGRRDLSNAQFNVAALEVNRAAAAPLMRKAGDALLAEQRRVIMGKRAHRGKPEKLNASILRAIAANPGASNSAIAKILGTSASSVSRRRTPPRPKEK